MVFGTILRGHCHLHDITNTDSVGIRDQIFHSKCAGPFLTIDPHKTKLLPPNDTMKLNYL